MKRVGLVLSFKGTNYGMMLQALATQHYIERMGYCTEIINCKTGTTVKEKVNKLLIHLAPVVTKTSIRSIKRRHLVAHTPILKEANILRVQQGNAFVDKYLHGIKTFNDLDNLTEYTRLNYSTVLIGSDQQWTPQCFYSDVNTLKFASDEVNKVSYATSMGVSKFPWYTKSRLKNCIVRMNYISVRENTGKSIIQASVPSAYVQVVPDPTLLLTSKEWEEIIPNKQLECEKYIFCYFLGNSDKPMKAVNRTAEKYGLKVVAIRNIELFESDNYDYGSAKILEAPSIDEFVNYIRNAEYVCTDSFHCSVFSIINHTQFATFYRMKEEDKNSRNSRIDDLLDRLNLSNRIVKSNLDIDNVFNQIINYVLVDEKLNSMRTSGISYLRSALTDIPSEGNILNLDKKDCCGCGLCVKKCPQRIIHMSRDEEGFYYPKITDINKCLKCGICLNQCIIKAKQGVPIPYSKATYAYAGIVDAIQESASGAVAYGLYTEFLKQNAYVCGVQFANDFSHTEYSITNKLSKISAFRGSKYTKAHENGVFFQIKDLLESGKQVFFVGLPCDVEALKLYLNKDYSLLYTCSLICHGPTSDLALISYIERLTDTNELQICHLNMRGKNPYWKPYFINAEFSNGKTHSEQFNKSDLNVAFQMLKRPSCIDCHFRDGYSSSDIIIGDFHAASKDTAEYNEYGSSIVFPITDKGLEMISLLKGAGYSVGPADVNRAKGNEALLHSSISYNFRNRFIGLLISKGLHTAAKDKLIRMEISTTRYFKKIKRKFKW